MPFDEDEEVQQPKINAGLKPQITNRSAPVHGGNKISQTDFENKVAKAVEKSNGYKERAAELAAEFKKMCLDKTLEQNKNIFTKDLEKEILQKMMNLAVEINNDPGIDQEGMGSLAWITLLFSTVLMQRDKINKLEYTVSQLEKKIDLARVDKSKVSE